MSTEIFDSDGTSSREIYDQEMERINARKTMAADMRYEEKYGHAPRRVQIKERLTVRQIEGECAVVGYKDVPVPEPVVVVVSKRGFVSGEFFVVGDQWRHPAYGEHSEEDFVVFKRETAYGTEPRGPQRPFTFDIPEEAFEQVRAYVDAKSRYAQAIFESVSAQMSQEFEAFAEAMSRATVSAEELRAAIYTIRDHERSFWDTPDNEHITPHGRKNRFSNKNAAAYAAQERRRWKREAFGKGKKIPRITEVR